jgi:hypothetical protein
VRPPQASRPARLGAGEAGWFAAAETEFLLIRHGLIVAAIVVAAVAVAAEMACLKPRAVPLPLLGGS